MTKSLGASKVVLLTLLLAVSCQPKHQESFDFEAQTGMPERKFYEFLNTAYSQRINKLHEGSIKTLFAFAGPPVKVVFENGMPTEQGPPGMDYLKASYRLDADRLTGFKLILPDTFKYAGAAMKQGDCAPFQRNIGEYLIFIHLPWYNKNDSSLVIYEALSVCPPTYHQGAGQLLRFVKRDGKWVE